MAMQRPTPAPDDAIGADHRAAAAEILDALIQARHILAGYRDAHWCAGTWLRTDRQRIEVLRSPSRPPDSAHERMSEAAWHAQRGAVEGQIGALITRARRAMAPYAGRRFAPIHCLVADAHPPHAVVVGFADRAIHRARAPSASRSMWSLRTVRRPASPGSPPSWH